MVLILISTITRYERLVIVTGKKVTNCADNYSMRIREEFTIKDIQRVGYNLSPLICRRCENITNYNYTLHVVMCEHCGFVDDGTSMVKQIYKLVKLAGKKGTNCADNIHVSKKTMEV